MTPARLTRAQHWTDALVAISACQTAVDWARTQPSYATAWEVCPDPAWLVWLVDRLDPDPRHIDLWLATCLIAERALRFVPSGEDRPRRAIECRRAWCRGEATEIDLAAARAAAWAAAGAAAWDAERAEQCRIIRATCARPALEVCP